MEDREAGDGVRVREDRYSTEASQPHCRSTAVVCAVLLLKCLRASRHTKRIFPRVKSYQGRAFVQLAPPAYMPVCVVRRREETNVSEIAQARPLSAPARCSADAAKCQERFIASVLRKRRLNNEESVTGQSSQRATFSSA